jgi:hypothetical protein
MWSKAARRAVRRCGVHAPAPCTVSASGLGPDGGPALDLRRALALLAPLALAGCVAHFPRPDEPVPFVERTTVGVSPGSGQLFEAKPALHVYFANGLDDAAVQARGGWAVSTAFSLLGAVRMMDEPSTPIRTPSYEPRLRLQLFRLGAPRITGRGASRLLGMLELTAAHYSNGQKGCALADHLRGSGSSDFDCIPQTDPPSTALNVVDGSFTTNYLGATLAGRRAALPPDGGPATWTAAASAGMEWHLPCRFSGCMDPPMRARYGEVVARWSAEVDLLLVRGRSPPVPLLGGIPVDARLRASAQGRVHFSSASGVFGDVALEAALVQRYPRGFGVGPFVRLHRGRDDLNIRFEERLDTWTFGVVIDPAPAEALPAPATPAG